ncbi:MAG: excinuclease ABC subunit C, partial [Acidobacteriaceae bacterium]
FLLERGRMVGAERLSTLGVRAVREQTVVGSSLFAQPLMVSAVAEEGLGSEAPGAALSPEERARGVLQELGRRADEEGEAEIAERCDALSLFRRWYYRPEKQRAGEVFLPNADGSWPVRRLLNGAARVVLGPPVEVDAVNREAARAMVKAGKTKTIHAGREGVEREVAVLPKKKRSRKAVTPEDLVEGSGGFLEETPGDVE